VKGCVSAGRCPVLGPTRPAGRSPQTAAGHRVSQAGALRPRDAMSRAGDPVPPTTPQRSTPEAARSAACVVIAVDA
jgi:hypothetical protein